MLRKSHIASSSILTLLAIAACSGAANDDAEYTDPPSNPPTSMGSGSTSSIGSGGTNTASNGTGSGSGSSIGSGNSTGNGNGNGDAGADGNGGAAQVDGAGDGGESDDGGAGGMTGGTGGRSGSGGQATSTGGTSSGSGGRAGGTGGTGSAGTGGTATGGATSTNPHVRGPAPTQDSASKRGTFEVKTYTSGLIDGADIGTQTMHYPVDAEPPFAGVVVVPGFTAPESSTRPWGPFLASHGIVTLTIGTNTGGESPDVRAKALLEGIAAIKAENTRAGSPLMGKIDMARFGVMGWSMGGGGTLIAANDHPELKAAIPLAAWSPGTKFSKDQVPTLLFAGSADGVAGGQSTGFYDSIPAMTPKMLFEVEGGGHDVANNPTGGKSEVGRYGLSWMKVFLEGDDRYRQFLMQEPTQASIFKKTL